MNVRLCTRCVPKEAILYVQHYSYLKGHDTTHIVSVVKMNDQTRLELVGCKSVAKIRRESTKKRGV